VCTEFSTLVEINRLNKLLTCSLRFLDDLEELCLLAVCVSLSVLVFYL
jgi:hypothetical protein